MTTADSLEYLARAEKAVGWLPEWREDLVKALAIMDTKGRTVPGGGSHLFQLWWDELRQTILTVADSIQEQHDVVEGIIEETDEYGETPTMRADRLAWEANR